MTTESGLLNERYRLGPQIGQGAQAVTHRATDMQTGDEVAIKILRLADVSDWKGLELFERETSTLRALSHPNIPGYLDDFIVEGEGGERTYHLVQEFVDGRTLKGMAPVDEQTFRSILDDLLEILSYLSSHSPPVVHRDIKPDNILLDAQGRAHLVDFGCVQVITPRDTGGSTVVGTTGFMAPEQLMGMSDPRSDLYGLGATCVYLLTGRSPAELEQKRMKIVWRAESLRTLDETTMSFVDRLIEPHAEDRFERVEDARLALGGAAISPTDLVETHPTPSRGPNIEHPRMARPRSARSEIIKSSRRIDVRIPGETSAGHFVAGASGLVLGFCVMVIAAAAGSGVGAIVTCAVFALGIIGLVEGMRKRNEEGLLRIEGETFAAQFKRLSGSPMNFTGSLSDFRGLKSGNEDPENLYVDTRDGLMMLGKDLSSNEQAWLCGEVSYLLYDRGVT